MRHLLFGLRVLLGGVGVLLAVLWPIIAAIILCGPNVSPSDGFWFGYFAYLAALVVVVAAGESYMEGRR